MSTIHDDPRYIPYTRHDRYGLLGKAPQSMVERCRLALLAMFVLPIRLTGGLLCLLMCNLSVRLALILPQSTRGNAMVALGKFWCSLELLVLGIRVTWLKSNDGKKAAGIVSNHCR